MIRRLLYGAAMAAVVVVCEVASWMLFDDGDDDATEKLPARVRPKLPPWATPIPLPKNLKDHHWSGFPGPFCLDCGIPSKLDLCVAIHEDDCTRIECKDGPCLSEPNPNCGQCKAPPKPLHQNARGLWAYETHEEFLALYGLHADAATPSPVVIEATKPPTIKPPVVKDTFTQAFCSTCDHPQVAHQDDEGKCTRRLCACKRFNDADKIRRETPMPCIDPTKMNGYADQFGGSDYP